MTRRWVSSPKRISVLDGLNRYSYVHDNPTTATDPSGHEEPDGALRGEGGCVATAGAGDGDGSLGSGGQTATSNGANPNTGTPSGSQPATAGRWAAGIALTALALGVFVGSYLEGDVPGQVHVSGRTAARQVQQWLAQTAEENADMIHRPGRVTNPPPHSSATTPNGGGGGGGTTTSAQTTSITETSFGNGDEDAPQPSSDGAMQGGKGGGRGPINILQWMRTAFNAGKARTVAFATFLIGDAFGILYAVSGENAAKGTVPNPTVRLFTTIPTGNNSRMFDAEAKILEYLGQYAATPGTAGVVNMYIYSPANMVCPSCQDVIAQFTTMFPNITMNYDVIPYP